MAVEDVWTRHPNRKKQQASDLGRNELSLAPYSIAEEEESLLTQFSLLQLVSPTHASNKSNNKILPLGLAQILRTPLQNHSITNRMAASDTDLSFYPLSSISLQKIVNEATYYRLLCQHLPSWITADPGNCKEASSLYPTVAGHQSPASRLPLSYRCKPELSAHTKNRISNLPGFNGEGKNLDLMMFEEVFQYSVFSMLESYFEQHDNNRVFFTKHVPYSFGILAVGPMAFLIMIEWVSILFYSFVSKPFFLGSDDHIEAMKIVEEFHSSMQSASSSTSPSSPVARSDDEETVKISFNPRCFKNFPDKAGFYYSKVPLNNNKFYKIVTCWALNQEQFINTENNSKKSFTHRVLISPRGQSYASIVGEDRCFDEEWKKSSVYFYHVYQVYSKYQQMIQSFSPPPSLVPMRILFGPWEIAIESDFVGTDDLKMEDLTRKDIRQSIQDSLLYLGSHGLLYIDLRPQNIRIDRASSQIYLIDLDDCVILTENIKDWSELRDKLWTNETSRQCLTHYQFFD
eukprot:scaffold1898_cov169-Ochromonas_danica.AAC.4